MTYLTAHQRRDIQVTSFHCTSYQQRYGKKFGEVHLHSYAWNRFTGAELRDDRRAHFNFLDPTRLFFNRVLTCHTPISRV